MSGFDGKAFAAQLPTRPGVYLMRDEAGSALYVGKARDLQRRVASYFDSRPKVDRIMRMLARVESIEVSLTRTEGEALLLENEWIKALKPRYNILLRDDKSYPWIALTAGHPFPRIAFHRGARDRSSRYFGPYPSASSVRESIALIQKLFRIRNCEDSYFEHRRRPCLQYQIQRCTAPCVGLVEAAAYADQVADAVLFLEGKDQKILARLIRRMEDAAARREYEAAAVYRDQIQALKQMQAQQFVAGGGDVDFVAIAQQGGKSCVQVVSVRKGRNLGQRSFFPRQADEREAGEVLEAFLGQHYAAHEPPRQIVLSHAIEDRALLESALAGTAGHTVRIQPRPRSDRRQMVQMAAQNAAHALSLRLASEADLRRQFEALRAELALDEVPHSIECFDISHTAGTQAVGACVAFDASGPVKSRYRRYLLRDITPGDDYAALKQVLTRRFSGAGGGDATLPDLVLIDGGRGQLQQAIDVLAELGVTGIALVGIAKGASRRAGHEEWVRPPPAGTLHPGPASPASHLVQRVRDEAHRFAITGHRARRGKAATHSTLEDIPGIGPKRRRQLLSHFGGLQGVKRAGIEELASVPGIDRRLAEQIFRSLH